MSSALTIVNGSRPNVIVFEFQVSDQISTVAASSFTVTEESSTTANNINVIEKAQSESLAANVYHGFPVDVERLLKMFPCELSKIKAKDKSRNRILVSCNLCSNFEDEARKASVTGIVPYASSSGVRTEGELGAKRLIDHLKSKAHAAALDAQQLQIKFQNQSDKHPWLNILKKHRSQEVAHLVRLAMDCYNDTMCETVSGYSWPSRSLTSLQSDRLVQQFSQEWDCQFQPFIPTPSEMHYRDPHIYYEMLSCIAAVCRLQLKEEIDKSDAIGIQIDGSCDRQQLGIKFVTARVVCSGEMVTRFLGAFEPSERGANGLLEALGRSIEQPADLSSHLFNFVENDDDANASDDNTALLASVVKPNFKAPVFRKVFSLATDGEAANTGSTGGLWKKLTDEVDHFVLCLWCVCHRSDLAFHDVIESVPEMKRWYSQVKSAVTYFTVSSVRTKSVKKECNRLGIDFQQFQNPPDVRFAEHLRAMCGSLLNNMPACNALWQQMCDNPDDKKIQSQAAGYLKQWKKDGQQYKLTALMIDILHHLACLQKEFQKSDILLFDVPEVQSRYLARITEMIDAPYPGGWEEKLINSIVPVPVSMREANEQPTDQLTFHASQEDGSSESAATKRRRTGVNKYVTSSERSYHAIRTEIVQTTQNFLKERVNSEISSSVQQIAAFFLACTPREMATKGRALLKQLKMDEGGMQLMDDCSDLFIKVPALTDNQKNLQQRFQLVYNNVTEKSPIAILVNLVLSAAPHSMVVERAVSHYNIFRNDRRLSMSLQSVNDRLLVALNGVGTGNFDPRPAVAHFLGSKRRRYREPKIHSYSTQPFMKKFFRTESEVLM